MHSQMPHCLCCSDLNPRNYAINCIQGALRRYNHIPNKASRNPALKVKEMRNTRCRYGTPCNKLRDLDRQFLALDRRLEIVINYLYEEGHLNELWDLIRNISYYYPMSTRRIVDTINWGKKKK